MFPVWHSRRSIGINLEVIIMRKNLKKTAFVLVSGLLLSATALATGTRTLCDMGGNCIVYKCDSQNNCRIVGYYIER